MTAGVTKAPTEKSVQNVLPVCTTEIEGKAYVEGMAHPPASRRIKKTLAPCGSFWDQSSR